MSVFAQFCIIKTNRFRFRLQRRSNGKKLEEASKNFSPDFLELCIVSGLERELNSQPISQGIRICGKGSCVAGV